MQTVGNISKNFTDYDPEDEPGISSGSDDGAHENAANADGREHYETVPKSALRQQDDPMFGSKYESTAVKRVNLENEASDDDPLAPVDVSEDEDPFAIRDTHDSEDSASVVEAEEAGDISERGFIPDAKEKPTVERVEERRSHLTHGERSRIKKLEDVEDFSDSVVSSDEGSDHNSSENSDVEMEDGNEEDDTASLTSAESFEKPPKSNSAFMTDREKLKAIHVADTSNIAASLSASAAAEAQKGRAIRQQRNTYDLLLDSRIKFQKILKSINDTQIVDETDDSTQGAISEAELAILSLLNEIHEIRRDVIRALLKDGSDPQKSGKDAPMFSSESSLSEIWSSMQKCDDDVEPHRLSVLDHWSTRSRMQIAEGSHSTLTSETKLSAALQAYLATETSKLLSQPNGGQEGVSPILAYNDDAFYQALLRDLIASRAEGASADIQSILPSKRYKSNSSKKVVDTKASKGRKLRYTVHEKLQNFMAPEDRTTWTESACREFFSSLFGQRTMLNEADIEQTEDLNNTGEEQALRLFRQ